MTVSATSVRASVARLVCPTLDSEQSAEYIGVTAGTLNVWRCTKRYPLPYIKVGRKVRYRLSDLDAFLASRTIGESAEG